MTVIKRFGLLGILWLVITAGDPAALPIGMLAALAATLASLRLLPANGRRTHPLAILRLVPGFARGSIRGGVDVARRAFHPSMPLKPGWMTYPVRLPAGPPRMVLGAELSLMPGTLAAGGDGRTIEVHCLDLDQPVAQTIAAQERRIAASIGVSLEKHDD